MSAAVPSVTLHHQQSTTNGSNQPACAPLNMQGTAVSEAITAAFQQTATPATGKLQTEQLPQFLSLLRLQANPKQVQAAIQQLGRTGQELSRDDVAALCQLLACQASPQASTPGSGSCGPVRKTPSKQRLSHMDSGHLRIDDAVISYMQRLDEHRKRCELTGRYAEAAAAANRIQDLKAAQADKLRGQLLAMQQTELTAMQQQYRQDTQVFDQGWRERVAAYEAGVAAQLETLKATHEAQVAQFLLDCEVRRPQQPQHSAEYLNSRKIEEILVKQGQYRKAHELKVAADAMYQTELASTHQAWDSEVQIRKTRLLAKQQSELDVLLQRAARGRDELELRRIDEAEKRHNRFRCMVQELDSVQRLEVMQLENYLSGVCGQGQANKQIQIKGNGTVRRKKEQLGLR